MYKTQLQVYKPKYYVLPILEMQSGQKVNL